MNQPDSHRFENLMIIDDNTIDLYLASRLLAKNKVAKNILQYSSAVEALQYLQENCHDTGKLPAIILLDIYMPIMDGFEFMEAYEGLHAEFKGQCRVFMLSSSIDASDIDKANSNTDIKAFYTKPISTAMLDAIQNC